MVYRQLLMSVADIGVVTRDGREACQEWPAAGANGRDVCMAKDVNIKVIVNGQQVKLSKFCQISACYC